jgi:hypothetical protein
MMNDQASCNQALEALYTTFASYPLRHPIVGCPCCVSVADQKRLESHALRQLDSNDLARFSWKAMTTWGDENDFRHFLPRVLELLSDARERRNLPELFVIFGKLRYGHYQSWPQQEQGAIIDYLLLLWQRILDSHPGGGEDSLLASDYLEALLAGIDDLAPFLDAWHDRRQPSSLCHLAELILHHAWKDPFAQHTQILTWLRDRRTREMLEEGFYAVMDEVWVDDLGAAADMLAWL